MPVAARCVYSQVFASTGGEHGILDLLSVTRTGRLAIIELKASEHIHLPLQAADYWLRVKKHLERGEISRYGYCAGVELQQIPPIVYLVAPARFHPSTDELLKFLSPELEVVRVGLAESWRLACRWLCASRLIAKVDEVLKTTQLFRVFPEFPKRRRGVR